MKSKVYFSDMRASGSANLLEKLDKLMRRAGIEKIDMEHKFVAIKLHFGEYGNLAFLRPNWAKVVADLVKEKGGFPFLTDCNTLYVGYRNQALEHLDCANMNGFNPITTGCQIIIGDGLRGDDETLVPVKNGEFVKEAKIGHTIMDADIVISLSHFKGHENAGFGGALKNLGMGCASRAGKMEQHSSGKPEVLESECVCCKRCTKNCAVNAISYDNKKAFIDHNICVGCGRCIAACPFDAISFSQWDAGAVLGRKMVEYAQAVCQERPTFHVSLAIDISPNCDCHSENDAPILPNLGMFASFDPVALDQACVDMALAQTPMPNSQLSDNLAKKGWKCHHDHFLDSNPNVEYKTALEHAQKIGLGSREYELVVVK